MRALANLWRGHLGRSVLLAHLIYGLIQVATDAPFLIDIMNPLLISLACGALVAYAPHAWHALTVREVTRVDALVAGIWYGFAGTLAARIANVAARNFGFNIGTTDWVTSYQVLTAISLVLHLNAPNVIEDRVPPRQWRRLGIIVALGVMAGMIFTMYRAGSSIHP